MALHIPSPPVNGFHLGPAYVHIYGLMYVVGITAAVLITQRRWKAHGGDPTLVGDVAIWSVPAGILGGRIYFDITTPQYIPHHWYGVLAVWDGGLGIWGGIALGGVVGIWRLRKAGVNVPRFMDAVAPALLVAQAIGRIGNYFNQELFGGPTSLPWGLEIGPAFRPLGYARYTTFHPTFLYELIFDLALAAALVWLGHHRAVKPPGLFAIYVTGYSAFRIFEESLRVDPSEHFLGLRLNFFVACVLTVIGAAWFVWTQRPSADPGESGIPVAAEPGTTEPGTTEPGLSEAESTEPVTAEPVPAGATADATTDEAAADPAHQADPADQR